MTSSMVELRRSSKAVPKAKLAPKKDHGHCLVVCCTSDPLQHSEYQWNHYIWEVCSANQWDALKTAMPASGISKQNRPNPSTWQSPTTWQPTFQKLNKLGYKVLPHPPYSSDLSPTDYHFFKCLNKCYQGKCFHNLGGIKCSPRIHWILKHEFFLQYRNKQTFSHLQKCVDYNGSYFD